MVLGFGVYGLGLRWTYSPLRNYNYEERCCFEVTAVRGVQLCSLQGSNASVQHNGIGCLRQAMRIATFTFTVPGCWYTG